MADQPYFVGTIVEFCRFVRLNGILVGPKHTLEAVKAAELLGILNRPVLKLGLRALLCSCKEEWELFDKLFEDFWSEAPASRRTEQKTGRIVSDSGSKALISFSHSSQQAAKEEGKTVVGAGLHERLVKIEFSEVPQSDLMELEKIAHRLLRRMAFRLARRLKRKMAARGIVDIRRTIHSSLGRGGDPLDLRYKTKRREQNRLVLLLDVSGSMNAYSLFLLQFAYMLQKHFRRVHTFIFSTRLIDVTARLRSRSLNQSLAALAREAIGWSGGTKIGESLRELHSLHGRRLLNRDTLFIILSDGWDTGEPQTLAAEIGSIRNRVKKTIWLNPLLGLEGYEPLTRGMSAALPYLDVFASAHNLESLLQLERHLSLHR